VPSVEGRTGSPGYRPRQSRGGGGNQEKIQVTKEKLLDFDSIWGKSGEWVEEWQDHISSESRYKGKEGRKLRGKNPGLKKGGKALVVLRKTDRPRTPYQEYWGPAGGLREEGRKVGCVHRVGGNNKSRGREKGINGRSCLRR